jgi:hypothetical protein
MATRQMSSVIGHLRRTALLHDGAGLTDRQLLGCFIEKQDDTAFEALVRRHGPMANDITITLSYLIYASRFSQLSLAMFPLVASVQAPTQ